MKPLLHVPLDFEMRDDLRTLTRLLAPDPSAPVCAYLFRLWLEWARAGVEWRPMARPELPDSVEGWQADNLTHLIEGACGWSGESGRLIHLFVVVGTLRYAQRGDLGGLLLEDFAQHNPHLLPGYVSVQAKGGFAKAERQRAVMHLAAAAQQDAILREKTPELFSADVDEEERRRAIALVMGFDTACGRRLRSQREYEDEPTLLREAVLVLRRTTPEDHVAVQRYLVRRRHMPDAQHDAAPVIRAFDDFLCKAKV